MQNINKIESLIKEKKLTKKFVCKQIGYSASGFNKAIREQSFKVNALIKLTEILGIDRNYFFSDEQKYTYPDKSVLGESSKVYGKIETDDLLIKIISRLDNIIELLEKKQL